jgi:hypothetical protein
VADVPEHTCQEDTGLSPAQRTDLCPRCLSRDDWQSDGEKAARR